VRRIRKRAKMFVDRLHNLSVNCPAFPFGDIDCVSSGT
jgi:hypothetical protein